MMLLAIGLIVAGMMAKDSIFGFIFFAAGMMMLVRSVTKALDAAKTPLQPTEKCCPPHKWDYDINQSMYCKICKKSPGQIGSDYDKPY